jgi:hypothetical protein
VTTPVAVEGGVAGGELPMSAGTSFQGRRKPNGSACHRRIMAGVQDDHVPTSVDQVVPFTTATDDAMETKVPPLSP